MQKCRVTRNQKQGNQNSSKNVKFDGDQKSRNMQIRNVEIRNQKSEM